MVVGSAVPDLAAATQRATPRLLGGRPLWWDGHTVPQQLAWSLPVGLVLTWLVRRLLAPRLAPYLFDLGRFHLRDLRHVGRTQHPWYVISGSVLIGSLSHIVVDLFTHSDRGPGFPGLALVVGEVAGHSIDVGNVLQVVGSVGLSLVTVWELWRIGDERLVCAWSGRVPDDPPAPPRAGLVRGIAAGLLVVTGLWAVTQIDRGFSVALMTWAWLATGAACLLAVGLRPDPNH